MGQLFFRDTLLLDASAVDTLNFALDGVNAEEEVEQVEKATEEFINILKDKGLKPDEFLTEE